MGKPYWVVATGMVQAAPIAPGWSGGAGFHGVYGGPYYSRAQAEHQVAVLRTHAPAARARRWITIVRAADANRAARRSALRFSLMQIAALPDPALRAIRLEELRRARRSVTQARLKGMYGESLGDRAERFLLEARRYATQHDLNNPSAVQNLVECWIAPLQQALENATANEIDRLNATSWTRTALAERANSGQILRELERVRDVLHQLRALCEQGA